MQFNRLRVLVIPLLIGLSSALIVLPLWKLWGGDAVIHLIYGQNAADGRWFEFNPGEISIGTTSIGWTILLASAITRFGLQGAMVLQKALLFAAMVGIGFCIYRFVARILGDSVLIGVAVTLLCVFNVGYLYNAPLGMENPVFAFLVVLILTTSLLPSTAVTLGPRIAVVSGLVIGLSAILRPEGYVLIAVLSLMALRKLRSLMHPGQPLNRRRVLSLGLFFLGVMAVLLPVMAFQYSQGGLLFGSTSGEARIMDGRRASISLGPIWFDPAFVTRSLSYLPLTLAVLWGVYKLLAERNPFPVRENLENMGVTLAMFFVFYSFVTGATQFARYTMFLWGCVAGLAAFGLQAWRHRRSGMTPFSWLILVCGLLWMVGIYGVETVLRINANTDFLTGERYTLPSLVEAADAENQAAFTTRFLAALGSADASRPVSVVYNEVQIRHWLDQRVKIISADGRTAPKDLPMPFHRDGTVDEEQFLQRYHPDFIVVWYAMRPDTDTGRPDFGRAGIITELLASARPDAEYVFPSDIKLTKVAAKDPEGLLTQSFLRVTFPE